MSKSPKTFLVTKMGSESAMSPRRRQIPAGASFSLDSSRPPYDEHPYWQDGAKFYPFHWDAKVFDLVNAWWLAEAATLAYSEKQQVARQCRAAGLSVHRWFNKADTQAYVAIPGVDGSGSLLGSEPFAIIAFRGTESRGRDESKLAFENVIADCLTDADFKLVESGQGGKVHSGFRAALDNVWDDLAKTLKTLRNSKGIERFWFTGHSLGAALATLAADRYGNVAGLYTFGSPRVGDETFGRDFFVPTYRFVNNEDLVARVPPPVGYAHVGQLKYIDRNGTIHEDASHLSLILDAAGSHLNSAFNSIGRLRLGFGGILPAGILDHIPTLYAGHIWNSLPGVR